MSDFVLDASAILAVVFKEPGRDVVLDILASDAFISAVNLSEAISKMLDRGFSEERAIQELANLRLETRPFDETDAEAAGLLRSLTRSAGLSIGDRACFALGRSLGLPVVTADRIWAQLNLGVQVELIR